MKKVSISPQATPVKIVSPRGMTLITRENHATPIVSFCVYFPGGMLHEDKSNQGITHLMQRLLIKGARDRTSEEIAGELEFLGAYLSPFTRKEALGVSMSAVSKHFLRCLQIFADCMLEPRFDEEELEKEKKNIVIEIEKRKDDILNYCLELCEEGLFGDNPYGFSIIGRKESVERITRDDVMQWHRNFYTPERMVFALVGDIRTRVMQEKTLEAFRDFEHHPSMAPPPFHMTPVMKRTTVQEEREKKQVAISLGFLAPPLNSKEYFAFKVLDYLLSGMGSRLFINLRDKEGLAYMVSSSYTPRREFGFFKTYMQTGPDKKDRAIEGLVRELEHLKEEEPGKEEIDRTKHYMLGLNEISMQKKWAQASKLAFFELMGMGFDFIDRYPAMIKRVPPKEVARVARKYLDTENVTCSMIAPKA
jgi:zinc protease